MENLCVWGKANRLNSVKRKKGNKKGKVGIAAKYFYTAVLIWL